MAKPPKSFASHSLSWTSLALVGTLASTGCSSSSAAGAAVDGGPDVPHGPKIYVAMYGDNEITVIDQASSAIVDHIPVGAGPAVLLETPDGSKLYTANWQVNSLSSVNVATRAVSSIPLPSRAWVEAMSPDGRYVYAGLNGTGIAVIDTASDTVARTIATADIAESVIVSADGGTLYVAPDPISLASLTGDGTVESISAATGAVVNPPITVGIQPAWISISPDGTKVYALNFLSGNVSVVDTATWQVTATLSTGSNSQPIISSSSPNGQRLAVTNFQTDNVYVFDSTTNQLVNTLSTDGRPVAVGFSADSTLGYVGDFGHDSLTLPESPTSFLSGNLTPVIGNTPGHVTVFSATTGEIVGSPIQVGKGPTSLVVGPY